MRKEHVIAIDGHCHTSDVCVKTQANTPGRRWHVPTSIPGLREIIEQVPRPRTLVVEESTLADWLWRNLRTSADRALICDPRKNALIAKDGDKDDPIDASKLADLHLGGFLREVFHPESLWRQAAKQAVGLYHERVSHRVACANKALGLLRRWGVVVREKDFAEAAQRPALRALLEAPAGKVAGTVCDHVDLLWSCYDEAVRVEKKLRRELLRLGREDAQVARWQALEGIGPIRALTFLVYLDTPWRFASKQALWKYMGIGLVREHSGSGGTWVHVERAANRVLKGAILGAATHVIMHPENPFGRQYAQWRAAGINPKNARRNVARSQAAVIWGMWKNGGVYDPDQVGRAALPLR